MVRSSLRQLYYFLKTAEHRNISSAAKELGVSAPTISAAIDALEVATDCTLFERNPAKGVQLTEVGKSLRKKALELVSEAEVFASAAEDFSTGDTGSVSIGLHNSIANVFAFPIFFKHAERWPNVSLRFIEAYTGELLSGVEAGEIDLLILFDPEQNFEFELNRRLYSVSDLAKVRAKAVVGESSPLAGHDVISIHDLKDESYIALKADTEVPRFLEALRSAGVNPPVAFQASSLDLVRSAVGKGLGFTLSYLQPKERETSKGDKVSVIALEESIRETKIVLVCRKGREAERTLGKVIETCADVFAENADLDGFEPV